MKAVFAVFYTMFLLICLSTPMLAKADDHDQFDLIVNSDVNPGNLNRKTLRGVFTLKRSVWPNGTSIQLVVLELNSHDHQKFIERYLGLFSYQIERSWQRQIFSGSVKTPIVVSSYEALVSTISKTQGAIGYVNSNYKKVNGNENVLIIPIEY